MDSSPLSRYTPQISKKRVFPGGSSSLGTEPEVVEISPPLIKRSAKSIKQKEVTHNEVIDVDMEEDCGEVILIDRTVTNNKGKEALDDFSLGPSTAENIGSLVGIQSSKQSITPGSHNLINLDGFSSDLSYANDENVGVYCDDLMFEDQCAILQSLYDNIDRDTPSGVESPIPWLLENKKKQATASNSTPSPLRFHWDAVGLPPITDLSLSSWLSGSVGVKEKSTSKSSSSLQTQEDEAILPSSLPYAEPAQSKTQVLASTTSTTLSLQPQSGNVNFPSGVEPFNPWSVGTSDSKRKPAVSDSRTCYSLESRFLSTGESHFPKRSKKNVGVGGSLTYSSSHAPMGSNNNPRGVGISISNWQDSPIIEKQSNMSASLYTSYPSNAGHNFPEEASTPWIQDPSKSQMCATVSGSSTIPSESSSNKQNYGDEDEILQKFRLFKRFDTVQDHSDHHYSRSGSSMKQPSKNWAKKIQEEWKILEKDLPDTIFVRVYESRMDLLRAVIIGAEGTPYHDGLFFFDVFFPASYPNVPPQVYYHSGGLRINPNLYDSGKVCLSLLNTWNGNQKEKWIRGVSTMLQVLVSIQGLILNAKPYFNEPGYAGMSGSESGEKSSLMYNENTFILSLKTMVYTMRRPPKHFEDFVVGHFCKHVHDILIACAAYMDGAQVGCLVKGGVQDVDEGDKSCSAGFKVTLAGYIKTLVDAFIKIGAKDTDKFLYLAGKGNRQATAPPKLTNYL